MGKRVLFGILMLVSLTMVLPQAASAHVLISDDTKSIGAVLHVVPDDDPIAGQQSNLFFDVQTQKINKTDTKLTIINVATGQVVDVPIKVEADSITANYTFPSQGVYKLSLSVSSDKTYIFNHSQRVSRGVIGSISSKPMYPFARLALVLCGTLFLVLLVIMFNHRKEMWRHSTF